MSDKPQEQATGQLVKESDSQALTIQEPVNLPITPAQAKIDAIAQLTMQAYQKASTLELQPKEITALQEDFPDEAFQPGASGKEHLIYIEHAHLRDRLNRVFRPGQWAIIPRNRWAEDFVTEKGQPASRVYVEAMLCIRGCFVAEAIGDMVYYKNNPSQNYGDAVEGAKTAALRRCAKELGIGLQAWKKEWCEGWWKRRRTGKPTQPETKLETPTLKVANEKQRNWFLRHLAQEFDIGHLEHWARERGYLETGTSLGNWPLEKVPTSKAELGKLKADLAEFIKGKQQPTDKLTPQGQLAAFCTAAGFSFEEWLAWAVGSGNLEEDASYIDFEAVPAEVAARIYKSAKAMLKGLQAGRAAAEQPENEPPE